MEFFSNQLSIAWEQFQERVAAKIQEKLDHEIRFDKKEKARTKKEELTLIAKILAEEFDGDLCCFFLADEQDKTLKLEAGSISLPPDVNYSLINDAKSLSVKSYLTGKNFRIFGRKSLEKHSDMDKLKVLENTMKEKMLERYRKQQKNYINILMEHWLSEIITIGEKKLGLIKLFRFKGIYNPRNENRFLYIRPPFSDFESYILNRIQKHIFNIIFAHQTIQQRMEDMRNVLHQVIAPLNALAGHSTNIAEGVVARDRVPEKLTQINVLAKMAAKYARNFQKTLDIETGNIKLYKEIIHSLRSYLIGMATDYQALIRSKCLHIHVTPDTPNHIAMDVDKDLFDHAISNLIDNAVKYSFFPEERIKIGLQAKPRNPYDKENVLITAYDKGNTIIITISNWGIAISEEDRKNIFKREFRGAKAIDRVPIGTGIGLFLAREIIKLHNGQIELVPGTHENHIIFKITLPKDRGRNNGKQ
jgi:signal transduction histidine kinase